MKEKLKCFLTTEIESAKDETGTPLILLSCFTTNSEFGADIFSVLTGIPTKDVLTDHGVEIPFGYTLFVEIEKPTGRVRSATISPCCSELDELLDFAPTEIIYHKEDLLSSIQERLDQNGKRIKNLHF